MNKKEVLALVNHNEDSLLELFARKESISKVATRYYDDIIFDMYDHNFVMLNGSLIDKDYQKALNIKESRNEKHSKFMSVKRSNKLLKLGYDEEISYSMIKLDYEFFNIKENDSITYKNAKEYPELAKEIKELDILNYGPIYGEAYLNRKWDRFTDVIRLDKGLNFWGVYKGENFAGYCYAFYDGKVVAVDDLLVKEEYRHQYIASNLLKYIAATYKCPIMLHAYKDDTPKEMYKRLGFKIIKSTYEYLKLDK